MRLSTLSPATTLLPLFLHVHVHKPTRALMSVSVCVCVRVSVSVCLSGCLAVWLAVSVLTQFMICLEARIEQPHAVSLQSIYMTTSPNHAVRPDHSLDGRVEFELWEGDKPVYLSKLNNDLLGDDDDMKAVIDPATPACMGNCLLICKLVSSIASGEAAGEIVEREMFHHWFHTAFLRENCYNILPSKLDMSKAARMWARVIDSVFLTYKQRISPSCASSQQQHQQQQQQQQQQHTQKSSPPSTAPQDHPPLSWEAFSLDWQRVEEDAVRDSSARLARGFDQRPSLQQALHLLAALHCSRPSAADVEALEASGFPRYLAAFALCRTSGDVQSAHVLCTQLGGLSLWGNDALLEHEPETIHIDMLMTSDVSECDGSFAPPLRHASQDGGGGNSEGQTHHQQHQQHQQHQHQDEEHHAESERVHGRQAGPNHVAVQQSTCSTSSDGMFPDKHTHAHSQQHNLKGMTEPAVAEGLKHDQHQRQHQQPSHHNAAAAAMHAATPPRLRMKTSTKGKAKKKLDANNARAALQFPPMLQSPSQPTLLVLSPSEVAHAARSSKSALQLAQEQQLSERNAKIQRAQSM